MFYAASQIVFLLLVAAAIGGGIGYGIAQSRHVNVSKALDRSGANKAMERDLANATAKVAELTKELDIANETIRRIDERRRQEQVEQERRSHVDEPAETEPVAVADPEPVALEDHEEVDAAVPMAEAPEAGDHDDADAAVPATAAADPIVDPIVDSDDDWPIDVDDELYEDDEDGVDADEDVPAPVASERPGRDVDLENFEPVPEPEDADEFAWTAPVVASQRGSKGGRRLSERVADASTGNGSSAPYDD